MKLQSGKGKQVTEYNIFTQSDGDKCYEKAKQGGKRVIVGIDYPFRGVNLGGALNHITIFFRV